MRTSAREKVNLVIEAGYRFLYVASSAKASIDYADYYNYYGPGGTIKTANASAGVLAADAEFRGNTETSFFIGIGALIGGTSSATFEGADLGEIKFSGLMLRTGVGFVF